jgi:ABC-type ATPase with predicted acetyltransferase domain
VPSKHQVAGSNPVEGSARKGANMSYTYKVRKIGHDYTQRMVEDFLNEESRQGFQLVQVVVHPDYEATGFILRRLELDARPE